MKRLAYSLLFGAIGLVFQLGMPILAGMLIPGDLMQRHGEDEAGRQLMVYFLFGGALFFLLWAWIGSTFTASRRKAAWMIAGVLLGTIVIVLLPRLLPLKIVLDDWRYDAVFIVVWVATSAAFAYLFGRKVSAGPI